MKSKNKTELIGSIVFGGLMALIAVILIISGQILLGAMLGLLLWCAIYDPFGFDERKEIKKELERLREEQERQRKEQETLEHVHFVLAKYARQAWPELTDLMIAELAEEARQKKRPEGLLTPPHT
jgi:hypothetical protein